MKKNIFENYIKLSNIENGLVAPVEFYSDTNVLRMLLDTKELIVKIGKELTLSLVDIATGSTKELGVVKDNKELETIFGSLKDDTFNAYHYSIDNLKNSI